MDNIIEYARQAAMSGKDEDNLFGVGVERVVQYDLKLEQVCKFAGNYSATHFRTNGLKWTPIEDAPPALRKYISRQGKFEDVREVAEVRSKQSYYVCRVEFTRPYTKMGIRNRVKRRAINYLFNRGISIQTGEKLWVS